MHLEVCFKMASAFDILFKCFSCKSPCWESSLILKVEQRKAYIKMI